MEALEQLVGNLVAASPAIAYGWLHIKSLEILKETVLFASNFNKNFQFKINDEAYQDLKW